MRETTTKVILLAVLASALAQDCPLGQYVHPVFQQCEDCNGEDNTGADTDPACAEKSQDCPPGQKYDLIFSQCEECSPGDSDPNCGPGQ